LLKPKERWFIEGNAYVFYAFPPLPLRIQEREGGIVSQKIYENYTNSIPLSVVFHERNFKPIY
jgi:hypothetical protein